MPVEVDRVGREAAELGVGRRTSVQRGGDDGPGGEWFGSFS